MDKDRSEETPEETPEGTPEKTLEATQMATDECGIAWSLQKHTKPQEEEGEESTHGWAQTGPCPTGECKEC